MGADGGEMVNSTVRDSGILLLVVSFFSLKSKEENYQLILSMKEQAMHFRNGKYENLIKRNGSIHLYRTKVQLCGFREHSK